MNTDANAFVEELWSYAAEVPMEQHPSSTASSSTAGARNKSYSAKCHLPVIQNRKLAGPGSISNLVKSIIASQQLTIE